MKYLAIFGAFVAIFFLCRFTADAFKTRGVIYESLNEGWTIKFDNKIIDHMKLPMLLDRIMTVRPGSKASLVKRFSVPKACLSNPCYLFFGEVGDLARVSMNGLKIKTQGYADGYQSQARHHPLWIDLPNNIYGTAIVQLDIESMYGVGFGIPKGPLFVGDYAAVVSNERLLSLQSVTFPLMQTLVLSILGLLGLVCWKLGRLDGQVFLYGLFAFSGAAFMLSFSYLPREYLSVPEASSIHFTLRLISDWTLFECINSLLPLHKKIRNSFRISFLFFIGWVVYLYFQNATYPEFVTVIRMSGVLLVGAPISGFIGAIYYWRQNQNLLSRRYMDVELLGATFFLLSLMQLWDTSIFWGVINGSYLVKFYLAPLAFIFAVVHVLRYLRNFEALKRGKAEAEKDAILGRIAMEFSHDLKSPLGSLRDWSLKALQANDPEFTKAVLEDVATKTTLVTRRLQELFNYAKDEIQEKTSTKIKIIIDEIKLELASELKAKNLGIEVGVPSTPVSLDPSSFKRAVLNLVLNAIQASDENGSISVTAKIVDRRLILSIQDFGIGIEEKNLSQVFDPYFTTNKPHGTGLGLSIVDRIARQHGGHVEVFSKKDIGSTFVMEIPQ